MTNQPYQLKVASDGEEAIKLAQQGNVDLILLDVLLPSMDGFEVCNKLKNMDKTRNVQIVMITCLGDMKSKIKSIELGADDFLVKPVNREELKARVKALLNKKAYMDGLSSRFETALNAAITDKLTGLYNHSYFKHFLDFEIKRSLRQKHSLALIMIDIDDFKQYNDTWGHLAGDGILKDFKEVLKQNTREVDLAARYGGEEFAVVLPYADRENAVSVAERIRTAIHDHPFSHEASSPDTRITASMGIAFCPADAGTVEKLIHKADMGLYTAKRAGKNQVCVYEEETSDER
jgi:two-component system cell cycle response regulator